MKKIILSMIGLFLVTVMALAGTDPSNTFSLGDGTNSTNKAFRAKTGSGSRDFRYNTTSGKWEFSNDGTTYTEIGSGGGGGSGGILLNLNGGFEEGAASWTASGGTFTQTTTLSNVGFGLKAGSWDPSAASQTLSNALVTIPSGLYGKTCSLSWYYKGGDANYKAQVYDGTSVIAESSVFSTQTDYSAKQVIYFTCPVSGQMQARFISSADAALIYLDDVKLGQEILVSSPAQGPTWSGYFGETCAWTRANAAFGDPAADATCTFTERSNSGMGTVTPTAGLLPKINLTAPTSGIMEVCVKALVQSTALNYSYYRIFDGTNSLGDTQLYQTNTQVTPVTVCGFKSVTRGDSLNFALQWGSSGGSNAIVNIAGTGSEEVVGWTLKYVKGTGGTEDSITINQTGWRIDANIGGANPDLTTSTISSYTEVTDGSLDLVLAPGSAAAEIPCSTTNPSTGLTCSAGSESIGLAFTPPSAGTYEVCTAVIHNINLGATGTAQVNFQLVETPNNAQTILQEGNQRNQSGMDTTTGALNVEFPNYVCGVFNFNDTSKRTIRLMREQVTGGTVTNNRIRADRSTSNGQRDIHFKVRRRVEFADVIKIAPPTSYAWSGTHGTDCNWTTTSTTTADPSVDSSCTFSQVLNNNFGSVISHSSGGLSNTLPGITFTCPATGFYNVYAQTGYIPSAASNDTFMELTDGTTQIAAYRQYSPSANTPQQVALGGLTSCTVGASVTLRLKGRIDGGTFTMGDGTAGGGNFSKKAIYWNISKAN